jgi:hypothetical protein
MTPEQRLDAIIANGFDLQHDRTPASTSDVRCSQCEALVINGVPCHESGCPNKPTICRECGNPVPKGERCDCLDPIDDDPEEPEC